MDLKKLIFNFVVRLFPDLPRKLETSGMNINPEDFVARTFLNAFGMMVSVTFFAVILAQSFSFNLTSPLILIIALAAFFVFFMIGIGAVDVRLRQMRKKN
ncbi:MAG: hypothetical protein Sv326_0299 [Candidatus Fermentimicrarchaeum limneticum]|uniref:Uncharacterized protein n=1 Tax=Fermentimicrarchaeum limneticum TaxID=2795018 RepID=A0A7D5XHM8_FERL1|nr:MAG: hypothetical protein Sv326_0299 [Candidatus Fermentimicrarchaeum limneticum]